MAYQKVGGTPRFYIDHMQYLKNINFDFEKWYEDYYTRDVPTDGDSRTTLADPEIFTLDPTIQKHIINEAYPDEADHIYWDLPTAFLQDFEIENNDNIGLYTAFLNHNMNDRDIQFFMAYRDEGTNAHSLSITKQEIINYGTTGTAKALNGFSIIEPLKDVPKEYKFFRYGIRETNNSLEANELGLGSLSYGIYYDMPVSPNLDLSMEIEFDGANNIKTLNGSTITQANYQGSPWWYDKDGNKVEPWYVGESTGISKRNGRRVWKLKFSYMSDKDLFASNYGSSTYLETSTDVDTGDIDELNLGQNIITNGDFSDASVTSTWTGSEEANLVGWANSGTHSATNKFTISSNECRLQSDGTFLTIYKSVLVPGNMYEMTVNIKTVNSGKIGFRLGSSVSETYETTGIKTLLGVATSTNFEIKRIGSGSDIVFDDVVVRPVNPSDFQYTIDNDDSFSAQVLNKISHGEKFIFQPDNTANNPSDFAICVLDGDSFDMKRTAPNVYDIEMTIREVW